MFCYSFLVKYHHLSIPNNGTNIPVYLYSFTNNSKKNLREFPGGPVLRTPHFHCQGPGSIPGQGTKIPQAAQHDQKRKKKKKILKWNENASLIR